MRFTCRFRPSWIVSSIRAPEMRRTRAGLVGTVVELDARPQPLEVGVGRLRPRLDLVDLVDLVGRVREAMREVTVVRQEQRARRVGIEPPDRDDARGMVDQVDDGRPSLRVARGRHRAGGLVQQDVGERLLRERLAVEAHLVGRLHGGVELPHLAVHGDAAGLDQLVGLAPRGDPGARDEGVEAHLPSLKRVRRVVPRTRELPGVTATDTNCMRHDTDRASRRIRFGTGAAVAAAAPDPGPSVAERRRAARSRSERSSRPSAPTATSSCTTSWSATRRASTTWCPARTVSSWSRPSSATTTTFTWPRRSAEASGLHDELGCWVTPVICPGALERPFVDKGVLIAGRGRLAAAIRSQPRHAGPEADRLARLADRLD